MSNWEADTKRNLTTIEIPADTYYHFTISSVDDRLHRKLHHCSSLISFIISSAVYYELLPPDDIPSSPNYIKVIGCCHKSQCL